MERVPKSRLICFCLVFFVVGRGECRVTKPLPLPSLPISFPIPIPIPLFFFFSLDFLWMPIGSRRRERFVLIAAQNRSQLTLLSHILFVAKEDPIRIQPTDQLSPPPTSTTTKKKHPDRQT
jgi:hypothetical protein